MAFQNDPPSQEPFPPRRRRALLSFRRKSDMVWFLFSVAFFLVALTLLVFDVPLREPAGGAAEAAQVRTP